MSRSTAIVCCVSLLLIGCSEAGTPVPEVDAISHATAQAGSARMAMDMTMVLGEAGSTRVVMEGVTTLGGAIEEVEAELEGRIELPGLSPSAAEGSLRMVDGRMFASGIFAQSLGSQPDGWTEISGEQREAFAQLGGGMDPTDPTAMLSSLETASDLRTVGAEPVRGDDTRHLNASTTYLELMEAQDVDPRDRLEAQQRLTGQQIPDELLDQMLGTMRDLPVELDLWVDGEDRIRRTRMETDLAPLLAATLGDGGAGGGTLIDAAPMIMTFEMFDFGVPVHVEVPEVSVQQAGSTPKATQGGPVRGMAGASGTAGLTIEGGPSAGTYEGEATCRTTDLGAGTELDLHLQVSSSAGTVNLNLRTLFVDGSHDSAEFTLWGEDGSPQSGSATALVSIGPETDRGAREFVDVDFAGDISGWSLDGTVLCRSDNGP